MVVDVVKAAKRILLVDDEEAIRAFLSRTLTGAGYQVAIATDGRSALEWLATNEADLVLLDVSMGDPELTGFHVCRLIRNDPRTARVPVIFLTSKRGLMDMAEGEDAGSDLYLIKPVSSAKLLNMVAMFLSNDLPLTRRVRRDRPPEQ